MKRLYARLVLWLIGPAIELAEFNRRRTSEAISQCFAAWPSAKPEE